MTIGSEIKKLREGSGLSRQRLSDKVGGISTSYLHYLEHDEILPSAAKLTKIVKALGGDPGPLVQERDRIELERLGHDAQTTVLFKEEFGDLTTEERDAARKAVERVRRSKQRSRTKASGGS